MGKRGNKGKIKDMPAVSPLRAMRHTVREKVRLGQSTATAERLVKVDEDAIETLPADARGKVEQRINAAPLDRLDKAGRITKREFEAGDRYRKDAFKARIDPGAPSVDFASTQSFGQQKVPAVFVSQGIADARVRWRQTDKAMRGIVKEILELGLIQEVSLVQIGESVFGMDNERDSRSTGYSGFRTALAALADYYDRP